MCYDRPKATVASERMQQQPCTNDSRSCDWVLTVYAAARLQATDQGLDGCAEDPLWRSADACKVPSHRLAYAARDMDTPAHSCTKALHFGCSGTVSSANHTFLDRSPQLSGSWKKSYMQAPCSSLCNASSEAQTQDVCLTVPERYR